MTVLVVGAGPTGLTLACGLLLGGADVRVVDAADGPATTSRALGLQPRGLEVLDRLGALGTLPDRGVAVREVVINVGDREITRLRVGGVTRLVTRPGVIMSQAEIEGRLRDRLAELGGKVEWGTRIDDLDHDGWIAGCDGAHSAVRHLAGIGFPGVPLSERFLLADLHADLPLDRHAVHTWLTGDQMFALFPLPGADLWRMMAPATGRSVEEVLAEHRVTPTAVDWVSSFRIHRRLADTYRAGRVLLAGDAAHIHSPFGGQGMNTGIGDAENLAWKLALVATGRAAESLLDTYEAERRPVAAGVLSNTSSMTRVLLGRTAAERLMRDHVLVPLMNRRFVQRLITEASSQLRVSYRKGLAIGRGPHPGDRVPGLTTRLLGRWGIVGDEQARRRVEDRLGAGSVVRLRGSRPMLVRPDGHLATAGDPIRWLDAALGPA